MTQQTAKKRSATSASTTIRVSTTVRDQLQELAARDHRSINETVEDLLKERRRTEFWRDMRAATERLMADEAAAAEYLAETQLWDTTSSDGLDERERDEW